jgi:hypothetical protein
MLQGPCGPTPSFLPCKRYQRNFIWASCIVRRITIREEIDPQTISINVAKDKNQRCGSGWTPKQRTRVIHHRVTSFIFNIILKGLIQTSSFFQTFCGRQRHIFQRKNEPSGQSGGWEKLIKLWLKRHRVTLTVAVI